VEPHTPAAAALQVTAAAVDAAYVNHSQAWVHAQGGEAGYEHRQEAPLERQVRTPAWE